VLFVPTTRLRPGVFINSDIAGLHPLFLVNYALVEGVRMKDVELTESHFHLKKNL